MDYLQIEELLFEVLFKYEQRAEADSKKAKYILAKQILFDDILDWIRTAEPNLSDHGPEHINNVLNNAYHLMEPHLKNLLNCGTETTPEFSALDFYYLCLSILFHDVGNIFKRKKHNLNIDKVIDSKFNSLFPMVGTTKKERNFIIMAGRAHTGKGSNNSDDTLKDLDNTSYHINGNKVRLLDIAAILRFADELAEGPQRTSSFMNSIGGFDESSRIFHEYAECTDLLIDRSHERISIHYSIPFDASDFSDTNREKLSALLEFIYSRLLKLEEERKYNRYYSKFLSPIKRTVASIEFIDSDSFAHDFKIDEIELNDLVVPGNDNKFSLTELRPELVPETLLNNLKQTVKQ